MKIYFDDYNIFVSFLKINKSITYDMFLQFLLLYTRTNINAQSISISLHALFICFFYY